MMSSRHIVHVMYVLRALLCLLLIVFSLSAQASKDQDLILERSLFIETSADALTIEQAAAQHYQPFGVVLNRGLSPTIRWIKLRIQAPAQGTEQVVLRVGPHYIRDIQVFVQTEGVWSSRSAGDRFPATQQICPDYLYCFPVTVRAGIDNTLFIRVDTINGFFLTTRVMQPEALTSLIVEQQRNLGLELGVIIALAFWALIFYIRTRHTILAIFFISQIVTALFTLSSSGLLAGIFFDKHVWLDNLTFNTLYIFRLMASLLVSYELLKFYSFPRWYGYYVKGVIAILCVELLALKLDYLSLLALNFNFLLLSLMPFILTIALPGCDKMPVRHKRLIAAGALLMGILLWVDIVSLLGWVQSDLVSPPGNWGSVIVAVVLSLLVLSDVTQRRVRYDRELQELQFMRTRNLIETEQIKERSMLIDMLTHELKNPLATMRMAAGSLRRSLERQFVQQSTDSTDRIDSMIQAINNMNTVIERCVQVDQLDQKGFSPKFEDFDVNQVAQAMLASQPEAERIEWSRQSTPLMVRSDPNLFAIILANLVDNAVKYSQPNSSILLELFEDHPISDYASHFVCRVTNTVGDHNAPDPGSLFNRYYRGEYAHDKSGTGLGLYLVKSLCKILGGSIRYELKDHTVHFTVELKP